MSRNPPTLKSLLDKANVSQNQAAKALDVHATSVTHWCQGRNFPRIPQAQDLAELLGCSLDEIIEGVRAAAEIRSGR